MPIFDGIYNQLLIENCGNTAAYLHIAGARTFNSRAWWSDDRAQ